VASDRPLVGVVHGELVDNPGVGALTDGHLYRLLVAQRSWSTADFNRWLSDSLAAALLPA
jgi:hypothetical protein